VTGPVAKRIRAAVRDWVGGRRIVLAGLPIAATPRWIGALRSLGAGRVVTAIARRPVVGARRSRRARPSDAEAFALAVRESIEHLRHWMPWAVPVATETSVQHDRLLMADASWADGSDYEFAMLPVDERRIIGGCGLMRRIGPGAIEIGYWVHVDHTGRGHATAAARALTEAAWTLPDVERVEIHCDEANAASAGVPARLGYRLDRIQDDDPQTPAASGRSMIWIAERPGGVRTASGPGGRAARRSAPDPAPSNRGPAR
jgi:RimJ/RimL family protein N-acetyltransferase